MCKGSELMATKKADGMEQILIRLESIDQKLDKIEQRQDIMEQRQDKSEVMMAQLIQVGLCGHREWR